MTNLINRARKQRDYFVDELLQGALAPMGFELNQQANTGFFNDVTDTMIELYATGRIDDSRCGDLDELAMAAESLIHQTDNIYRHNNFAHMDSEIDVLQSAANATLGYLCLYEAKDISIADYFVGEEGTRNLDIVAALLRVKQSTLRNIITAGEIYDMNRSELRAWLETEERFKPYVKYKSVEDIAPFNASRIQHSNHLLYVLMERCKVMKQEEVWNNFASKAGIENSDSGFVMLAKASKLRSDALSRVVKAANLVPETIDAAFCRVKDDIANSLDSMFDFVRDQLTQGSQLQSAASNHKVDSETQEWGAQALKTLMNNEFGFDTHPADRGKNKKMLGMLRENVTVTIETLKTPVIWILTNNIDLAEIDASLVTQYEPSEDGKGRHSGLMIYGDLATGAVFKIKLPSSEVAKNALKGLRK